MKFRETSEMFHGISTFHGAYVIVHGAYVIVHGAYVIVHGAYVIVHSDYVSTAVRMSRNGLLYNR